MKSPKITPAGDNGKGATTGNDSGIPDAVVVRLVRDCYQAVWWYMARSLGQAQADGATQDVFVDLLQALRSRPPGRYNPRALTWRIARRVAADRYAQLTKQRAATVLLEENLPAPQRELDPVIPQELAQLLARLAPLDQKILTMRYAAGYSSAAIARATGLSQAVIRQHLSRSLRRLKEEMKALS